MNSQFTTNLKYEGTKLIALNEVSKMNTRADLSVVIIARNEARNIARAIESVLKALEKWPQTEVLLVDSASTDKTVEIAKRYPINIVRLPTSWFHSVGAGRLIGMHYTRGEFILHMDGDAELDPEWVNRAMSYALEHPEVGAVGAYYRNMYIQDGKIIGEEDIYRDPEGRILEVKHLGVASLYRREAIENMGGFQPWIRGEESVYLCMGLRHAGYKLVRLPYLGWRHYCVPDKSIPGSVRRLKLNLWLGFGQVPRYLLGTDLFWEYIKLNKYEAVYFIGILISFLTLLLTILSKNMIYLGSWMFVVGMVVIIFSIKKHSVRKALLSLLIHTLIAYSAVRGFFMPPKKPNEYPTDAEIVQVSYQRGGLYCEASSALEIVG